MQRKTFMLPPTDLKQIRYMYSQMNKPCYFNYSSKIKAVSPPDSLKRFLIVNTLPVSFCRRVGLLWKISVALARQLDALSAENLLDGSACVADLSSTAVKVSISLFSVRVVSHAAEDCQRQHWNDHRSICRAISSGAWRTVVLDRFPENTRLESASIYTINRYDDLNDKPTGEEIGTAMPPNTHGDKYYLVKLQMPLGGQSSHILVYDQQKSLQLFIRKDLNPEIFDEAVRAFGGWPKMYRWTQRVGDREWRMCFDQVPGIDPHW